MGAVLMSSSTFHASPRTLVWAACLMLCLAVISSEGTPVNDVVYSEVVPEVPVGAPKFEDATTGVVVPEDPDTLDLEVGANAGNDLHEKLKMKQGMNTGNSR